MLRYMMNRKWKLIFMMSFVLVVCVDSISRAGNVEPESATRGPV